LVQDTGGNFSSVTTIKNNATASPTTTAVRINTFGWTAGNAGNNFDPPIVTVQIFR